MSELTHLDGEGRARMVDVGAKAVTRRVAVATGRLDTTPEVVRLVVADDLPKADVLATARIAGIQGAKRTSELIPLAHLLPLEKVELEFEPAESSIAIRATVAVTAKTGVEMEALTAVAIAGLTLHDMIKAIDPAAVLGDIRLVEKTGASTATGPTATHTQNPPSTPSTPNPRAGRSCSCRPPAPPRAPARTPPARSSSSGSPRAATRCRRRSSSRMPTCRTPS